jgi:hypothetical protein
MNTLTPLWFGLAIAGFIAGLWVRPKVLVRIAIGLFLLAGLGLVACNTLGYAGAAYWFGVAMGALAVVFGVAILGSIGGWMVRRLIDGGGRSKPVKREFNGISS